MDYKKLIPILNKAADKIHKSSTRGSGNFIITSDYASKIINNLNRINKRISKIKNIYGCK
jgi:hypothetical protein